MSGKIVLLAATHRGYLFLKKLHELVPDYHITVFSFREEPWEPPFFEKMRELTLAIGGTFFEAKKVGDQKFQDFLQSDQIELMFCVSWRYMVPASIYRKPFRGAYVFHDSLLPRYRGFSPTVWAMVNGESETGVTLFEMVDEVDAGGIVAQKAVSIDDEDTIQSVLEKVTASYIDLLEKNLMPLLLGTAEKYPQDHTRATFTCKRLPDDNRIDWCASSKSIYNLIRAVSYPYPGAYTSLNGKKLLVWSAELVEDGPRYEGIIPGRVVAFRRGEGATVLTASGPLLLREVQIEGGERVCASLVLNRLSYTLK